MIILITLIVISVISFQNRNFDWWIYTSMGIILFLYLTWKSYQLYQYDKSDKRWEQRNKDLEWKNKIIDSGYSKGNYGVIQDVQEYKRPTNTDPDKFFDQVDSGAYNRKSKNKSELI
jgi:hypothetical protein